MVKYKEHFNKYEKNRWAGLTISLCIVVVFYMLVSHIGNFKDFFNSFLTITSTVIIATKFSGQYKLTIPICLVEIISTTALSLTTQRLCSVRLSRMCPMVFIA